MSAVNRCALVVRPKEPYLAWANGVDDGSDYGADQEHTVYLAPDFNSLAEMKRWLEDEYAAIFEQELRAWMTDEATWPSPRDFALFRAWFAVEYSSIVIDLCNSPLEGEGP